MSFFKSLIIAAGFIVLAGVMILALMLHANRTRTVQITVHNASDTQLNQVELHFTGGSNAIGTLSTGESQSLAVRPTGESDLTITFSAVAKEFERAVGVFLEPGYGGTCEIWVNSDFTLGVRENIRILPGS